MAKSKETIEKKENGKSDFTNSKKIRLIISERLTALKESKNLSQKDMAENAIYRQILYQKQLPPKKHYQSEML